jgi:tungstate transport system substrate-binding protein
MGRRATIIATAMNVGAYAQDAVVVAATTSVEDSGSFEQIAPLFTAKPGIAVRLVSRASATALLSAERGTVDVVMVNDAGALDRFVAAGAGIRRVRFMANQFVIVAPRSDPANITGMTDAAAALHEIARLRARARVAWRQFRHACRGAAAVAGEGQSESAQRRLVSRDRARHGADGADGPPARRLQADRATWLRTGAAARHAVLVSGDPQLFNPCE